MARVRSVDFLPEIFQTPVNKQFLAATLDQLIQEPAFQKTQGFVGRRVGPGVNANDRYVIEPTKSRNEYQLEPGVVGIEPESTKIQDVITYPGIGDALALQGAFVNNADRLYTSEYYAWDPFVDFDKFVNYQQYYWLPNGPLEVDVSATEIPLTDNYVVTRANGVYTFSGVAGDNPQLTLARGGTYTFQVAQNNKETVNYRVTNAGISAYVIDYENNPTLTLVRGNTYIFNLSLNGIFPFYIKTQASLGNVNTYDTGVTNNGATAGTITFVVPQDAPNVLYYSSSTQFNMRGTINIIDAVAGTGPGFWIQASPGVNGRLPFTPNISSRDVLGVTNNGEDLGTVTFNVPSSTAQEFYYTLPDLGPVSLITDLEFDQINGQPVSTFINTYNGIDDISDLNGRTLVFQYTADGWGVVPPEDRYNIWRITYVTVLNIEYIQLVNFTPVNNLEKFKIQYGTAYASTSWYKTNQGIFQQIPLLTAVQDVLYYQDATDPEIFGIIRLVDQQAGIEDSTLVTTSNPVLNIDSILGKKNYTSPNGVIFTNGLKVIFRGVVEPSSYTNNAYYVEGVGTAIQLLPVTDFVVPEPYVDEEFVLLNFEDSTLVAPPKPDYITINRASPDLNPWSRSNRWFHVDVINYSYEQNNTVPVLDNLSRGRRPILEFQAGTKLYDFGTQGKQPINIIDFQITDALSNINGTIGYGIDGYNFVQGTRVIFAADTNPNVRNKIYEVEFITPDTIPPLITQPIINLVPAADADVLLNQSTVCLSGNTLRGESFYYDGVTWIRAQEKYAVNQAPLFDVYDGAGISFGNRAKYPSSTFVGSKLLSYANGSGAPDPVLGYALKYLNLSNIGDIVFDNNLYTDTFIYVTNNVSTTNPVSDGHIRRYSNRVDFSREIGWQTAVTPSLVRQQFRFSYDGLPLKLDIAVATNNVVPAVQMFINDQFISIDKYTVQVTGSVTTITLVDTYVIGDIIELDVLSDQVSSQGFYVVPINLENNPLNANSPNFTLGTVRSHYNSIGENLLALQGPINGANNTRDLGNIVPYGLQILQQSSPLTLTGYFARNLEYDIYGAIEYNSREYIKYKNLLLQTVIQNDYTNLSVSETLDRAITYITQGRTDINPFYWSDMLASNPIYTQTLTQITPITVNVFDTVQSYDFTSANFKALLVYFTRGEDTVLLIRNIDYTVSTEGPTITVILPLQTGDIIDIREYSNTAGNFCPNTPTKMGLYPKYLPRIFVDTGYLTPTTVIQGHDGSITVAFGDIRDQVLLEFEKRIYDNLKTDDNPIPLTAEDVIPGAFRTTDYSLTEITTILGQSFLSWVGWNKLDYKTQDYIAANAFTWNYSSSGSKLTNGSINNLSESNLLGAWRGIYRYFYDTTSPDTSPWEMLGFTEQPAWWETRYGPAPYTSDNLVLWDDLELGLVADPVAPYIRPNYARPGLTKVIPVGTEGQLLPPSLSVMGQTDPTSYVKSWAVGDGGPVEYSWSASSSYPFAIMRLLALTRPAEFFSLFADRDLYKFNAEYRQYLYNDRYRLDASGIQIYGSLDTRISNNETITGVSKASYINWIVDYNQQLGKNSTIALTVALQNLDVRLCYRMASFTNKQYLKIYTEKSSPNSQNSSLLLPDESYNLLLYKNQPFADITYSAVIVERVSTGYAVYGYSNSQPYFNIYASASNGLLQTVSGGGASVRVPAQYTSTVVQIPYGYVLTNTAMVVDFILSYGAYLTSLGLIFDDRYNGYELNWNQMAQEFLYFSQQGWNTGTLINLNPSATKITAYRAGAVVDIIESLTPENMLLDQNRTTFPTRDLIIQREGNTFSATSTNNQTISYLKLRFVNYEHMVVLDNVSIFADLLYDPVTSARQYRVRIIGATTTDWNGQLDAQGFILNDDNVQEWQSNRKYTKGDIVLYKNTYWSAQTIVQPKRLFDYNDWVKSDYQLIQQGLLPNIANKADQLANSYNTYGANLERDNDLLSYGLIGFRPRQYMTSLNLDDVSQVNIYQQFLGTKGTTRAAELFTRADLGKESGEYKIYENWAVLAGTYGANANRSFFELRLNEDRLQSNPSTIQLVLPQQPSDADQTFLLSDIWRESYKITSTDVLPTTNEFNGDAALPSAGYVNINDIDITVFSLDDPATLAQNIESIGRGTLIWAAKVNSYDWNVYRCERVTGVITQLTDNLNETSVATFNAAHGLSVGDLIIIRYFNDSINGVYRVLSIPGIQQIVIAFNFGNTNQTVITGTGLAFYLQTARVAQASDVVNLPYSKELVPGAKVWVDDNGQGQWTVLQKQNPFTIFDRLLTDPLVPNSRYGYSIMQSNDNFAAIVGAPDANNGAGSLYAYRRNIINNYEFNIELTLDAIDTVGLGNAVAFGNLTWSVVGASASRSGTGYALVLYLVPGSNDYIYSQLLLAPDQNFAPTGFGTGVAISTNERWMYISAPGADRVYAYALIEVETQTSVYLTDGITDTFNYSNNIQIDPAYPEQLIVALENLINGINVDLTFAVNYSITATDVVLNTTPSAGLRLTITRRKAVALDDETYYGVFPNLTTGSGLNAAFTVNVKRGVYFPTLVVAGVGYNIGDTLTIFGTVIGGLTPANDLVITVTSTSGSGAIVSFSQTGSGIGTQTDFSLTPFLYTATNIESFTVTVNGQLQRPHIDYEFNNDSNLITQDLTFLTVPPVGATISVRASDYWQYVSTLTPPGVVANADYGASITTSTDGRQILIGAPRADAVGVSRAGTVYAYDRSVYRFLVTDTSTLTYVIPGTFTEPVFVSLNDVFLTNTNQYINGQFSVVGSDIVLSSAVSLTVGDVIEIETNQFNLIQTISAQEPFDESRFGAALQLCNTDCSLYTGSPLASVDHPQEGLVQRNVNQSRVYGVITSTIANPALTAGNTLRINSTLVTVPVSPNNTIAGLVDAINTAAIPNVIASSTPNLELPGDGITKIFDVGSIYSAAESYTVLVYVDDTAQVENVNYTYNSITQQIIFIVAPGFGQVITVVSGRMILNTVNLAASTPGNRLTVYPGTSGTAFADIGFETYVYTQTIRSPNPSDYAYFGSTISVDSSAVNLVVGAYNGNIYRPVIFDSGQTYFDDRSTTFFSPVFNSGVAYTFDFLPSANGSITSPGTFVFGQQIYDSEVVSNDQFSLGMSYRNGRLLVGAPGNDFGDSSLNYGLVSVFNNPDNLPSWKVIHLQTPVVKIDQINSVFMYDRLTNNVQTYFDYINPLQGKILGVARRNIDYIGAVDPAEYNQGPIHNNGNSWAQEHVGEIWWDTDTVRFIDPNQDSITYASRRWGQVFPGSRIDIYQWVRSSVLPVSYTGPGIPLSTVSYTITSKLNQYNIFETIYYFWVRGITTIDIPAGKTLSPVGIAGYIENPRGSGIPYIAPINGSTVAIYNALGIISAADTILHIEFDQQLTAANIHQEYQLIADGRADSFLNDTLYLKLLDSFCGSNLSGANVPDPLLSPPEQYGVQFRPRQSMFVDRFGALENYLERCNNIFKLYPIVESRNLSLLNSSEPEPAAGSGAWNKRVANLEELSFQNLAIVPLGYKYLVVSDSGQNGLWTIYELAQGETLAIRILNLVRVQNYDTRNYWYTIDWYRADYNSTVTPAAEVINYSELDTLPLTQVGVGQSVKVIANAQGKFEIYLRVDLGWERVGLENGTIQIDQVIWDYLAGNFGFDAEVFDAQYFDQAPITETRQIIRAINEQLLIDDLAIERNRCLMLMFNFIYSEFSAPEWLIKTSLVDVDHKIRALLPYQNYLRDNQEFVLDYIQEVKPYHVQVREFNLTYFGDDTYPGAIIDYDVPAYYKQNLPVPQFVSPVLTPYTVSDSFIQSNNSDAAPNTEIWTLDPWKDWFNNYQLSVQDVSIISGGSGYTEPPLITVIGDCTETASMSAVINSSGQVVAVIVNNPGSGYLTTAVLTFIGGNGTGARAVAIMGNQLIRSISTTIKYDRFQYISTIQEWQPNVIYNTGDMVRFENEVYSANQPVSSATWDFEQWTLVPASALTGVDRTMGYYVPTVNQPGLQLPLLIDGVEYPGVQVTGPGFNQNTGFDIGNFDINPFDNISIGVNGQPTYDLGILDAIYLSNYLDPYLGIRPTDVNVDGAAFVDTYSSHAPEELIPGAEFDTLDFRVYTIPGSDWRGIGHRFPAGSRRYLYDPDNPVISFEGIVPYPMTAILFNVTTGLLIEPLQYDWANYTMVLDPDFSTLGDILQVYCTGTGGGNQLLNATYLGNQIPNGNEIIIPFPTSEDSTQPVDSIYEFLIKNGEDILYEGVDYTYAPYTVNSTKISFTDVYDSTNRLNLTALGYGYDGITYSWSIPVFQTIIVTDAAVLTYTLTNSLQGTNPINLIVTVDGVRARPYESVRYISNGVTTVYQVPSDGGYSEELILDSDVQVYFSSELQTQGVNYVVDPWDGSSIRTITLLTVPVVDTVILISVSTAAQYSVVGNQLTFRPSAGLSPFVGQLITIVTWNSTRQQGVLTQVFVGPRTTGIVISEGYDILNYDPATVNDTPGSFDYTIGSQIQQNIFEIGIVVTDPESIIVSLDGKFLFNGIGYTISGAFLTILGLPISNISVLAVTSFVQTTVPPAMAFRIFQDMRGVQATYRITSNTTTALTQPLSANADVIYVNNASALSQPDLAINIWGVITIDGERIMYRQRDTVNNTVSSLLRGTGGTAAASHAVDASVIDTGRGNLLPQEYQDYVVSNTFEGDDTTTEFTATLIDLAQDDSTLRVDILEVYVGGIKQSEHFIGDGVTNTFVLNNVVALPNSVVTIDGDLQSLTTNYTISGNTLTFVTAPALKSVIVVARYSIVAISPATIIFETAPAAGVEVTLLVRQGVTWYAPGPGTPSNGVPLQETNTGAARFLRGQN